MAAKPSPPVCGFLPRFLCLVILVSISTSLAFAQTARHALSKEQLLALKNAGVNDSVLIAQIQRDGIDFDMTPDTTLELRTDGLSNNVLQTLFEVSSKRGSDSNTNTTSDSIRTIYAAGRFPELADILRKSLNTEPDNYRNRTLLVLTLMKLKDTEAAHAEYQKLLIHEQDSLATPYIKQVKALFDTVARTAEIKTQLLAALEDYRISDALAAIDQLPASSTQKDILKMHLDIYAAKYDEARTLLSKLQFDSYSEKERAEKIKNKITEPENEYKKLMLRLDFYLYSKWTWVACYFPISEQASYNHLPELASISATEYVELVNNLLKLAPLSELAQNLGFHAELLTGNYDDLERVGDHLLRVQGNIRIPFYSSHSFFQVVIDSRKKHIYTELDPHPFGNEWYQKYPKFSYWADLVPFDLAFDNIKEISLRAGSFRAPYSSLAKQSYALKFEPLGVAPNYSLMNILMCSVGETAELTATRNLGQYIIHVIGGDKITAVLADPGKARGASSSWFTGILMASLMASPQGTLQQMAIQGLKADQTQRAAISQAQQRAQDSFVNVTDTFDLIDANAFEGVEKLLGVLN
jgi:hypothetical protein